MGVHGYLPLESACLSSYALRKESLMFNIKFKSTEDEKTYVFNDIACIDDQKNTDSKTVNVGPHGKHQLFGKHQIIFSNYQLA